MKRWFSILLFSCGLFMGCKQNPPLPGELSSAALEQHVAQLASDEFAGRKPFTPGEEKTVNYLAEQLKAMGLAPGHGDSYFQDVPMVEIEAKPAEQMTIKAANGESWTLKGGEDYTIYTERLQPHLELKNSELVFCGYGVVAPEYNKNDYAGVDLRGKTALVLVNDPGLGHEDSTYFKGNTMTYYGRWTYKYEEAARQGAEAILIIHETTMAGYPFFVAASSWKSKRLNLKNAQNNEDKCAMEGWVTLDVAKKMMEVAGLDFAEQIKNAKKPSFKPVPMNLQVSTSLDNNFREDKSRNVVALLPGTTKSDEYIIYSAHWDHLGVGVAVNGDSIYNGAMDNASGTAALLTIAKAFSEAKSKPNRSVIFLFVTAEEQGLLGSAYYAEHPIFPTARTVANINLDGMNPNGPMKDLTITGFGHSDMDDLARREAEKQQRYILPDQEPEKGFFFRSDHFNFAKVGIPSIFASGGYDHAEKGKEYASQKQKEFTANHYHKPSDQYDPASWDFRGMVQDAELFLQLGWRLSTTPDLWPQWKPTSEFKSRRDEDLKKAGLKG